MRGGERELGAYIYMYSYGRRFVCISRNNVFDGTVPSPRIIHILQVEAPSRLLLPASSHMSSNSETIFGRSFFTSAAPLPLPSR